ncbi:MAG: hypothetical protein HOY79_06695 [Streptomyces sp.]|nr:hypothetical protein [Streptomyces sp.]
MTTDRRRAIERRLREISRDPASAASGEAQRLMAESGGSSRRSAPPSGPMSRPWHRWTT